MTLRQMSIFLMTILFCRVGWTDFYKSVIIQ